MPAELEQRLRATFGRLPKPGRDATARARAGALDALGPTRARRSRGGLLILAFGIAVLVGAGAAALAATGKLHVDIGAQNRSTPPVVSRLTVPAKTHGIAVVAGGRLWLATRAGLRIEGMPATTAELSPRALYAVVGVGSSLVAFAPGLRRAWTHPTGGPVVAAAWSPDGLKIAYVVRANGATQLRLIEGDGDHDRLLDRGVAPLKPGWRSNSLAIYYRAGHARNATFDLFRNRRVLGARSVLSSARAHARSPRGDATAVAVARPHHVLEVRIVRRRGESGPGELLLRVRAARSPVVISWR
jgi:hypothetical protein